ncbi:hypothetical protein MLD38_038623 [Melastoma candidum]|uniref:Uncharacterized protein n=1 Tax=Melastoma candidum TaxID=119954 RepID=A0ACB9KZG9_9MYRT|nr:hypothetical protein MLD38_038623 [Melastoma candidum]
MDQKMMLSAIGVGVGVGVGIGLASGQTVSKWRGNTDSSPNFFTVETLEKEMLKMVVDGKDSQVTFDKFPYYLSEQTRVLLTSAAYVHLKNADVSKYTRNLSPASRAILLSGPAELYQQMLAKALAHHFDAKLLLLDVTDFSLKIQSKYGSGNKEYSFKRSPSESTLGRLSGFLGSLSIFPQKEETKAVGSSLRRQNSGFDNGTRGVDGSGLPKLRKTTSVADNISSITQLPPTNSAPLKRTSSWSFDEKLLIQSLYKVLVFISKTCPIVLYLRDVDKLLFKSSRIYTLFHKMLNKLSGSVLILGSRISESESIYGEVSDQLASVFPYSIEIRPPEDENNLVNWKSQLEEDMKAIQVQDNRIHIMEVLSSNDLDCDDLESICVPDTMVLSNYIEEVVMSAISYHLMKNANPEYRNGKLLISSESLSHGLSIFQEGNASGKDMVKLEAHVEKSEEPGTRGDVVGKSESPDVDKKGTTETLVPTPKAEVDKSSTPTKAAVEVPPDNEFEKRIRPEVIPASEIEVTFADIGALDETKESLQELVMLPLRRPDLFRGGLLKPCRGILLFGPPGTGKTMLAKAVAREAGASFINVSMSTITSKWFGEDEKNVRALFTLAAKVSPTIIFVDEVDSMLGQRSRAGEHEAMRKIKNEFMTHWDGLLSKAGERILVLAATNRPFDLDEAIIRRFERRIMIGLPGTENRENILKTLLAKEKVKEGFDYKELATMTEGYSGSDLKNLCTTAAYRPVRELLQQEMKKEMGNAKEPESGDDLVVNEGSSDQEERTVVLRALTMDDFKHAKDQVAASYATDGASMAELKQWNELYGEGGSRKKQQLTYFL